MAKCNLDLHPDTKNWVEEQGGLDPYLHRVACSILESGHVKGPGHAIAAAWEKLKRWSLGGEGVHPDTVAKAQKALANMAQKRARSKAKTASRKVKMSDTVDFLELSIPSSVMSKVDEYLDQVALSDVKADDALDVLLTSEHARVLNLTATPREYSKEIREKYSKSKIALEDGSYPIPDVSALKDAIKAYGRANPEDRGKVRAHIISRARSLNASFLIPKHWK